jgi:hypothetical protein
MKRTVCVGGIDPSTRESHSIFTTISSLLQAPGISFVYRFPNGPRLQANESANLGVRRRPQLRCELEVPEGPHFRKQFMTMDMTTMSAGMAVAMVLVCLIILAFVVLGIAAFIKYLRS